MRLRSLPTRLRRGRARVLVVAAAILACAGAVGLFTAWAGLTGRAEQQSLDWRWQLRGHQSPDRRLAMVAMDDESLQRLGFTWPISRHDEARVLTALGETGASTVVYMVGFDMPGPSRTQDGELLEAMAGVPGLVLPAVHADADGPRFLGGGKANREQSGAVFGGDLEVRDDDGAVRRLAVDDEPLGLATVPIVAAEHALRHPVRAPGARPWLDLPSAPCALNAPAGSDGRLRCSMPAYTLRALLAGRIPADALTDKVVVVAYTGSDLQTLRQTWAGGARLATSGELLAHEIGTALRDFPLRSTAWWWTALATLLLCCVPVGAGGAIDLRLRTRIRQPSWIASAALVVVAGLAALVLGAGAAALAFGAWGRVVPVAAPAACVLVATGLAAARAGALVRARAGDVWRTAGSLAPEQLVARIIEDTRGRGLLTSPLRRARGAEHAPGTVEMTILFADLRDSTTYVMALDDPTQTWAFSQAFMQHAITAIENHGGYAQSLEGDGLLAMFGPWYGGEDHAGLAITAALDLTGPALEAIRAQLADGLAVEAPRLGAVLAQRPLGLRVAVHSGEVHYGTSGRVDGDATRYSASTVGQTTHLAAKLRAVAAPSKRERWDRDSQAALFERDSTEWAGADERIVVVSEETMAAARRGARALGSGSRTASSARGSPRSTWRSTCPCRGRCRRPRWRSGSTSGSPTAVRYTAQRSRLVATHSMMDQIQAPSPERGGHGERGRGSGSDVRLAHPDRRPRLPRQRQPDLVPRPRRRRAVAQPDGVARRAVDERIAGLDVDGERPRRRSFSCVAVHDREQEPSSLQLAAARHRDRHAPLDPTAGSSLSVPGGLAAASVRGRDDEDQVGGGPAAA